jgi:hypothetical protein
MSAAAATPEQLAWGRLFAEKACAIAHLPHLIPRALAYWESAGLDANPAALMDVLATSPTITTSWLSTVSTLEAAITYLEAQLGALQDDKQLLQSEVQTLQSEVQTLQGKLCNSAVALSSLAAAVTAPATLNTTATPRRKTTSPVAFSGAEKDAKKRQIEYQTWRAAVQRVLLVDEVVYPTEFDKIMLIAECLSGDAARVHHTQFATTLLNRQDPSQWIWKTADAVLVALDTEYNIVDLARSAALEFDKLWMRNSPFPNFLARFLTLAEECCLTNSQKVSELKKRVSDELGTALRYQDVDLADDDFAGWTAKFQRLWQRGKEDEHYSAIRATNAGSRSQPRQPAAAASHYQAAPIASRQTALPAGDPMILDRTNISREECAAKGLCFYCKKPGHTRLACELKRQNDAKTGGQQQQPLRAPVPQQTPRLTLPYTPRARSPYPQYGGRQSPQLRITDVTDTDFSSTTYTPSSETPVSSDLSGNA